MPRTAITDALQMFLGLINAGIIVVTLADDKTYDRERINDGNFTDLIISLTILSRANEESRMKSKRVAASWARKRQLAWEIKMSGRCAGWARLSEDKRSFEIVNQSSGNRKKIARYQGLSYMATARSQPQMHTHGSGVRLHDGADRLAFARRPTCSKLEADR